LILRRNSGYPLAQDIRWYDQLTIRALFFPS
jgi:hypothetical protein